ncbi:MAG: FtsX-like permease family protein [Bacteroidales bacterium]|nr:FtsX-like permease family protein [Bacteroidales bacterium]
MFKYYIKIGFRNILKYKNNSIVNIISLSLGIAILLLIGAYSHNELSVDNFHTKASQIVKVSYGNSSFTPGSLSGLLKTNFPEIQDATHIETHMLFGNSPVLNFGDNSFEIEHYYSADSTFFNIFDFEVIYGDLNTALNAPFSIILTESEAIRFFKKANPIGEIVTWKSYKDFTFTVKAIVKDPPQNSSIQFNGLISVSSTKYMGYNYSEDWGFTVYETYLLLKSNVNQSEFEQKLKNYLIEYYKTNLSSTASYADAQTIPLELHPLKEVYFNKNLIHDTTNRGNLLLVHILITVGIVIMLLSIINYINLSTALASIKTTKIGIQKVLGSSNRSLIFQFLSESTIISLLAAIFGFIIAKLFLSSFSLFMDKGHSLEFSYPYLLMILIPGVFLIGIIAGIYPAFFMVLQKPLDMLKKKSKSQYKGFNLRFSLIIFQFLVSMFLIAVTLLIYKQVNYLKDKNLGINIEHIIYAKMPNAIRKNRGVFRERLQSFQNVKEISYSSNVFGQIEGMGSQEVEGKNISYATTWVDAEFIDLYKLQLIEGRFFSNEFQSDLNSTALLNQTAFKEFDLKDPYQLEIRVPGGRAKVVGVVKDFNFKSLHTKIEPIAIIYLPRQGQFVNIKLSGDNVSQTLKSIENIWEELAPDFPFSYHFLDSSFENLYKKDERMGKAITSFSLIAIVIALIGIFGLSTFLSESRVKEISIRKINGAKIWQILLLLNMDIVKSLVVAFVIACPLSWYVMSKWLENFAYKTEISFWIFIVSGLIASFIALMTVTIQSWRFATRNPVDTLRYE